MNPLKFTIILILLTIFLGIIFGLIFTALFPALAQTIKIGVYPAIVKFQSPGTYQKEFCFFNEGDTDAIYETMSGEVIVNYQKFLVPKNTLIGNCIKKNLTLTVRNQGYFYIVGKPNVNESAGMVSLIRRVGIKVELESQTTTTTISGGASGGSGTSPNTVTTITNNSGIQKISNTTTTTIKKVVSEEDIIKSVEKTINTTKNISNQSSTLDKIWKTAKVIIKIAVVGAVISVIVFIVFYFLAWV
jgi:hypothetical protein